MHQVEYGLENIMQWRADMESCLMIKSSYSYICFYTAHKALGLRAREAAAEGELLLQAGSKAYGMWCARRRSERHLTHLLYGRSMPQTSIDMVQLVAYHRAKKGMWDAASSATRMPPAGAPSLLTFPTLPAADKQQGQMESSRGMFCDLSPTCQL